MATDWGKIFTGIGNAVAGFGSAYGNIVVAQAQVGVLDTNKSLAKLQINIAKENLLSAQQAQENTKRANLIVNKINNYEYITQDEYDFLIANGVNLGFSYNDYIDTISQPKQVASSSSVQYQDTEKVSSNSKLSNYLILGGAGLVSLFLIKRFI